MNIQTKEPDAQKPIKIRIPEINLKRLTITVKGITPLIVHKFGEKAKKMILDKQQQKIAKGRKKEIRDPEKEYHDSRYIFIGNDGKEHDGFPVTGFKQAIVRAGSPILDIPMTKLRLAMFLTGEHSSEFVTITGKHHMREDTVRIGQGTSDLRYRPEYPEWTATFGLEYQPEFFGVSGSANKAALKKAQEQALQKIMLIINAAGQAPGVGEWRPERNGSFGRFRVTEAYKYE